MGMTTRMIMGILTMVIIITTTPPRSSNRT
jgi:hypothetical protein